MFSFSKYVETTTNQFQIYPNFKFSEVCKGISFESLISEQVKLHNFGSSLIFSLTVVSSGSHWKEAKNNDYNEQSGFACCSFYLGNGDGSEASNTEGSGLFTSHLEVSTILWHPPYFFLEVFHPIDRA